MTTGGAPRGSRWPGGGLHQDLHRQGRTGLDDRGDARHVASRGGLPRTDRATPGGQSAGGIRATKEAIRYLVLVNETAGPDWLTPNLFRLGASSLLNDLLLQRHKQATGRYWSTDYLTLD